MSEVVLEEIREEEPALVMDSQLSDLQLRSAFAVYFSSQNRQNWEMRKIYEADNVGSFLTLLNHTKQPSNFATTIELSVFRADVVPDWALEPCKSGGRWSFRVDKLSDVDIDQLWFDLVLAFVGGEFIQPFSPEVASMALGLAYSGKPQAAKKIALWMGCRDQESVMLFGHRLEELVKRFDLATVDLAFNDFVSGDKYAFTLGGDHKKAALGGAAGNDGWKAAASKPEGRAHKHHRH